MRDPHRSRPAANIGRPESEVQVWIGHVELSYETGLDDISTYFFHVVGFELQPNRPSTAQELTLVGHVSVEYDIEVVSQANEVPVGIRLRDLAS